MKRKRKLQVHPQITREMLQCKVRKFLESGGSINQLPEQKKEAQNEAGFRGGDRIMLAV